MATIETRHGVAQLTDPALEHGSYAEGEWAIHFPLTEPADFVVALAADVTTRDADRLAGFPFGLNLYSGMGLFGKTGDRSLLDKRNLLRRWKRDGIADAFLEAAKQGEGGHVSRKIATHLERVRFLPDGRAEVEDFLALAAWSVLSATMRGGFTVKDCELCGLPFLASPRARYCKRRAPASREQNCQQYAKVRDHRARRKQKGAADHGSDS